MEDRIEGLAEKLQHEAAAAREASKAALTKTREEGFAKCGPPGGCGCRATRPRGSVCPFAKMTRCPNCKEIVEVMCKKRECRVSRGELPLKEAKVLKAEGWGSRIGKNTMVANQVTL